MRRHPRRAHLFRGAGHDALFGDDGDDTLEGGTDNDALNGGLHDTCNGGTGTNSFLAFERAPSHRASR